MKAFNFANAEQENILKEIHDMCFFDTKKETEKFWLEVSEAGEFDNDLISDISFEMALIKAKDILHRRGMEVFRRKKPTIAQLLAK